MTKKTTLSPETPDLKTLHDYCFGHHDTGSNRTNEGGSPLFDLESPLYMGNKAGIDKDFSAYYHGKIFPLGNEIDEEKEAEIQKKYETEELSLIELVYKDVST